MRDLSIHLVTNLGDGHIDSYLRFVERALEGGVSCVQLREKNAEPKRLQVFALKLQSMLKAHRVPLIINDNLELAIALDAEGLHLGQTDGCPMEARRLLGPNKILGLSVESETQVMNANQLDFINYVGCGPVFSSQTKRDCPNLVGLEGLKRAVALSVHPVVAIGGIDLENVGCIFQTGCAGVAAVQVFHDSMTPEAVVRKMYMEKVNANAENA